MKRQSVYVLLPVDALSDAVTIPATQLKQELSGAANGMLILSNTQVAKKDLPRPAK